MNRSEFIDEIFTFFRCKDNELKKAYDMAFSVKEPIDWEKLYALIVNEAETRYLPAPKWFKAKFPLCIKREYITSPNDGKKVVVRLKDGYFYNFVLDGCRKTEGEIREGLYKKFQRGGANPIKSIEFYDKNAFIPAT